MVDFKFTSLLRCVIRGDHMHSLLWCHKECPAHAGTRLCFLCGASHEVACADMGIICRPLWRHGWRWNARHVRLWWYAKRHGRRPRCWNGRHAQHQWSKRHAH